MVNIHFIFLSFNEQNEPITPWRFLHCCTCEESHPLQEIPWSWQGRWKHTSQPLGPEELKLPGQYLDGGKANQELLEMVLGLSRALSLRINMVLFTHCDGEPVHS